MKVTRRENWRVEVRSRTACGDREFLHKVVREALKSWSIAGAVELKSDTINECSHCARPWIANNSLYNGCCDRDIETFCGVMDFLDAAFQQGKTCWNCANTNQCVCDRSERIKKPSRTDWGCSEWLRALP